MEHQSKKDGDAIMLSESGSDDESDDGSDDEEEKQTSNKDQKQYKNKGKVSEEKN